MILGPDDPRALRREDGIFTGATLADFDKFLDTDNGKTVIGVILDTMPQTMMVGMTAATVRLHLRTFQDITLDDPAKLDRAIQRVADLFNAEHVTYLRLTNAFKQVQVRSDIQHRLVAAMGWR